MSENREVADWNLVSSSDYPLECKVALQKLDGSWEVDVRYRGQHWYVGVGRDWDVSKIQRQLLEFCEGQDDQLDLAELVGSEV